MTATRTAILLLLTVTLFASTASGQVFVEDQDNNRAINRGYSADGVQFTTKDMNQTIGYKNVTYPDSLHDGLKKWQKAVTDKNNSIQIEIETEWAKSSPAPKELQGRKINAKYSVKKGKTKGTLYNGTYYDDKGDLALKVTAKSHLEHLIISYKVYNSSAKEVNGTLVPDNTYKNKYSGNETDLFPIDSAYTRVTTDKNDNPVQHVYTRADNRHENAKNVTLITAVKQSYDFDNVSTANSANISSINTEKKWFDIAQSQIQDNNLSDSLLIDSTNGFDLYAHNITLPADAVTPIKTAVYTGKKRPASGIYTYIVGSIAGTTTYNASLSESIDGFEDGDYTDNPSWSVGSDAGLSVQSSTVFSGSNSLQSTDSTDRLYYQSSNIQEGVYTFSVRPSNAGAGTAGWWEISTNGNQNDNPIGVFRVRYDQLQIKTNNNENNWVDLYGSASDNTWYTVQAHVKNHSIDFYAYNSGSKIGSVTDQNYTGSFTGNNPIDTVLFTNSDGQTMYWDDISYHPTETSIIEGFEPDGNFDNAWSLSSNTFTTQSNVHDGKYSANWQVDGSNNQEGTYDLTTLSGYTKPTYYSYWLKQTGGGSFQSGRTAIRNSDGLNLARVEVFRDSTYSRGDICGDSSYSQLDQYNNNWHYIEVKDIDYEAQTFDVYIDGNVVADDHSFCNNVDDATTLFVQSGSATTTDHYYDTFRFGFKNVEPTITGVDTTPSQWKKGNEVDIALNATDKNNDNLKATYKVLKEGSTYVSETEMNTGTTSDFVYSNAFTPDSADNYKLIMNVSDQQGGYNASITTQDVLATEPSVTLNSPPNQSTKSNPVTFNFTPTCYVQCVEASLLFNITENVTYNWVKSEQADWQQGTSTNLSLGSSLVLDIGEDIAQIYDTGFGQDGNGNTIAADLDSETTLANTYTHTTNSQLQFDKNGWYKVTYGMSWSSDSANGRHIMKNWLRKNGGTTITPSETRCYIRLANGVGDSCSNSGTVLVNANQGDYVELMGTKDHGTSGSTVTTDDVYLYAEPVDTDVAQVYDSSGGQDYDSGTITVDLDSSTKVDSPYTFSSSSDYVEVGESGWYKVYHSINNHDTGQGNRQTVRSWITSSGSINNQLDSYSYIRNTGDGDQNHQTAVGFVNLNAGDNIQLQQEKAYAQSSGSSVTLPNNWVLMEKIDKSDILQVRESSGGQRISGTETDPITFDTNDVVGTRYSHNTGTSEISVDSAGWYEVSYVFGWDDGAANDRHDVKTWLRKNGQTKITPSEQIDYTRGYAGGRGNTNTFNGVVYLEAGDTIELMANPVPGYIDVVADSTYMTIQPYNKEPSGNYTSDTFNAEKASTWKDATITDNVPAGTSYDISYAENSTGTWQYYNTFPTNVSSQYFKYNLTLLGAGTDTPGIDKINVTYDKEEVTFTGQKSDSSITNTTESSIEYNFTKKNGFTTGQTFDWNVEVEQSDGQTALADQNYTVTVTAVSVSDPSIANFSIDPSPFVVGDSFTSSADVVANSSNLKFVNITIEEPDGTVAVSDVEMVNVSNPASLYEYVYDTADQVTGIGEWNVTIDAENTEGGVSSQSETVDGIWSESLLNGLSSTETGGSQSTVGRERQEGVSDTGIAGRVLDIARQSMERVDLDIAAVKDRSMARSVASSITSRTSSAVQHIVNVASLTGISGDSRADRSVDVVRSLQETALVDTDAVKDRSMARAFTSAVVADSSVDFERSLDRNGTASIDTAGLTERQVEFARTFNEVTDVHIDTAREIRLARKALNAVASRDRLLFERRMERFLTAAQVVEDRDEVSLVYGRTGSEQSLVSDIGQRVTELARSVTRNVESVSMVSPRQSIERTMMEDIVVSTDTNRELDVARTILNQLDTSQTSDETAVWMTNPVTGAIMDWGDRRTNTYTFPDDITGYNGTKQDTTYTLTSLTGNSGTQSLVSKTYDVKKNTTATITVGGASGGTGDTYADAGIEYTSPPGNGGYIEATMDVSNASNISIVLGNKGEDGFSSSGGAGATADGGNGVQATYDTGLASYVSEGGPGGGDSVIKVDGEIVAYIGAGGGGAAETSYTNAGGSGGARGGSGVTPEDTSYESVATGNDAQGTGLGGNGSKDARIGSGGGGGVEVVGNDRFIDYSTQTGGSSGTATASVNMSSKRPKKIKYDNEQSFTNGLVEDISERDGVNATTASNNYTYQKYNVSIDSRQSKRDSVTVEWRGATANTTRAHLYVRDWNTGEWRHIETVDSSSLTTVNETFNGSLADDIVANQQITLMAIDP